MNALFASFRVFSLMREEGEEGTVGVAAGMVGFGGELFLGCADALLFFSFAGGTGLSNVNSGKISSSTSPFSEEVFCDLFFAFIFCWIAMIIMAPAKINI